MKIDLEKLSVVQKVVTPLAVALLIACGRNRRPLLFLPAVALGLLAVLLWFVRKRYEGDLYRKAVQLAEEGKHRESLSLLIKAEEAWAPNNVHSTPRSMTKDLRRLAAIVTAIQARVYELGGELDTEELTKLLARYIDVCSNKRNVVFGTNSFKAKARGEVAEMNKVFVLLRGQFRSACLEFYKSSDTQLISVPCAGSLG